MNWSLKKLILAVILLGTLAACQSKEEDWVVPERPAAATGEQIKILGVIRHLDLEGGVFTIQADDGTTYNPINLPAEFHKDGLAVEAEARRRDDMAGIHQVGPLVEIERIRSR
jgi:hypothetical protein